jgi:hypothetical protein
MATIDDLARREKYKVAGLGFGDGADVLSDLMARLSAVVLYYPGCVPASVQRPTLVHMPMPTTSESEYRQSQALTISYRGTQRHFANEDTPVFHAEAALRAEQTSRDFINLSLQSSFGSTTG